MTVYVVQESTRTDSDGNVVADKDLSSAREYGELVYLVPSRPWRGSPDYYGSMATALQEFGDDDYLLLTGAPEYIAAAGALAADANGGRFRVLRWLSRDRRYIPLTITVWEE